MSEKIKYWTIKIPMYVRATWTNRFKVKPE